MATTALEISVRPTRSDDLGAITRIYGYYVSYSLATFEIDPPPLAEMLRRFELLMAGGYPYFVAVANHAVLGYAYAGPHHARAGYRHTVENSVYVDHAQTGRGIGSLLLDALIGESESRGFRQMVAVIGDSANRASIRLHERCGFRPVGTFRAVGHKHGRWVDTMLMQRALGAGDAPI
jgi:L-amino acid N-acyltransferase YncA